MELCNIKDCTGCQACKAICPRNAIMMTETTECKTVPEIDKNACIECGLCRQTCPVLNKTEYREPISCYASWNLNSDDSENCASGGVATGLYKMVLDDDGVIYGCDYDRKLKPVIRRSQHYDDIELFMSSKYVQSSTEDTYKEVKTDLESGKEVLYVGTPCQIDGLLHFLKKKYDNLITIDIICHGVPPYKYLQDYVSSLKIRRTPTRAVFRGKHDFILKIYDKDDLIYSMGSNDDYYFNAFLSGTMFRDNCYSCRYARKERVSDMTIGDFWRLNTKALKTPCKGKASVVLTNTPKGEEILKKASDYLYYEEREIKEALDGNGQLNHPMEPSEERIDFLMHLHKGVYKALLSTKSGKEIRIRRIRRRLGNIKRKIIK